MTPPIDTSILTENQIRDGLQRITPLNGWQDTPYLAAGRILTEAAVLIPLFRYRNEWNLLFTHRTDMVKDHKGQVSFPGGAREPGDRDVTATALRETNEEIGISPADIRVLGRLAKLETVTNYTITPVVGIIPWPVTMKIEYAEVSHTFSIPLNWLADPTNHEERWDPRLSPPVNRKVVYFQRYQNELLWGVTGTIVVNFLIGLGFA
jgi:8-oxo-dGTP pyrophosphatase MutT (NUDIX family)